MSMQRLPLLLLLLTAMLVALWGCDSTGLPTQTPVQPTITPTSLPTEVPTQQPAQAAPTSTIEPGATSTGIPATATSEPTNTPTREAQETAIPTSTNEIATRTPQRSLLTPVPTVTLRPRPTRTPTVESVETPGDQTVTPPTASATASLPTTTPAAESAPSDGWKEVVRVPPGKHRIALTFDAGSTGEAMPSILAALRERNIHITMFITGKYAEQYPEGVRQAAADGNEIANHTYSHIDSRKLTDDQLTGELDRTEKILQNLIGRTSKPYWRPPFGARNNHVLNVAAAQGYRSIYWTLDSLDSVGQPKTPDFIFNRITHPPAGVNLDGAIILQHFGSQASADALPRELDTLKAMGLDVVTVSELISP